MSRFYYYATENIYQGLHGIEDSGVIEADNMEDACEYCYSACCNLIMSYEDIMAELEEVAKSCLNEDEREDEDKFLEMLDEAIAESCIVAVWEIDEEKAEGYSTEELDSIAYHQGHNYFIEEYCVEE